MCIMDAREKGNRSKQLSIFETLIKLFNDVEAKKENCRRVCLDCQKLLKPWPLSCIENTDTNLAEMCLHKETHQNEKMESLPPVEQKEISLVDEMLLKAQKAREVQNKLQAKPKKDSVRSNTHLPNIERRMSADKVLHNRHPESKGFKQLADTKPQKGERSEEKTPAVISKQKLDRLLTATTTKSQKNSSSSTTANYKPAHKSAPFKTEAATVRPRSMTKQIASAGSHKPKGSKVVSAGSGKQKMGEIVSAGSHKLKGDEVESARNHEKNLFNTKRLLKNDSQRTLVKSVSNNIQNNEDRNVENIEENHMKGFNNENCNNSVDLKSLASEMDLLHVGNTLANQSESSHAKEETEPPKTFDIRKEGSDITIPPKLRRLCVSNLKLREKINMQILTKTTRNTPSLKEKFIAKLKTHMDSYEEKDNSRFKRLCQQLETHSQWEKMLHKYCPLEIDEESTWKDLLKTKRTLEFVCTQLDETNQEFSSLLCDLNFDEEIKGTVLPSLPVSKEHCMWIPDETEFKISTPSKPMTYKKIQDILKYQEVLHTIQLLKLQLYTMDMVEKEILPLFMDMNGENYGNIYQLYRSIYSLLCTEGTRLPAIIVDDESTTSSEEGSDF